MSEKLKKDSPWDVQSSAPAIPRAPTKLHGSAGHGLGATWLDRPIAHPDDATDLETDAAIGEFHHKMPRAQAEGAAYDRYVRSKRVEASAHHLAGMRAAYASGDHEAGRKHSLLYQLHSKALGHDAVGPAHPEVQAKLQEKPQGVYRFKAHRGDLFAVEDRKAGSEEEKK